MDLYKKFGTNKTKETAGVWIMFEDTGFKVRRYNPSLPSFMKKFEEKSRPYKSTMKVGKLDDELNRRLAVELFVETTMIDWKNVHTRAGKDQKFSVAAAIELFMDLPEVYETVAGEAANIRNFQDDEEALETDVKNSETSSTTS